MNGIGLLVLLAATAQVDGTERDYGWQISRDDGKLEYIVQISPEKSNFLVQNGKEQLSSVPPEIAARLSRVVVRVGTEVLPRTPSLAEIERLVPLVNQGGTTVFVPPTGLPEGGRYATLESGQPAAAVPVNGNPQALPNLSSSGLAGATGVPNSLLDSAGSAFNSLSDAASRSLTQAEGGLAQIDSALERGSALLAQNTPSRSFLNDAVGGSGSKFSNTGTPAPSTTSNPAAPSTTSAPVGGFPSGGLSTVDPTGIGGTGFPQSTAPISTAPISAAPGSTFPQSTAPTTTSPNTTAAGGWTATPAPNTGGFANPPSLGGSSSTPNYPPNYTTATGIGNSPLNTSPLTPAPLNNQYNWPSTQPSTAGGYPSTGDFGNHPGGNWAGNTVYNPAAGGHAGLYDPPSFGGGLGATGGFTQSPTLVASNPNAGTTGGAGNSIQAPLSNATTSPGAFDNNKRNEAVLPIFFVLSLVVNVYLGMLIRKLLMRYRSLLSSVRSQTA
jgi:hypothetical protein